MKLTNKQKDEINLLCKSLYIAWFCHRDFVGENAKINIKQIEKYYEEIINYLE